MRNRVKIIFFILLSVFTFISSASGVSVQLEVKERFGANRTNAPVTYGIPFSKADNILSTSTLGITGKDAQFRVLSRYDGAPDNTTKPIRVVLADFQDTISANATNIHTLTNTGTGTTTGVNLALDKSSYIEVSTGSIIAQISKTSGNIFESVTIGNTPAVSSPTDDKFTVVFNGTSYNSTPTSVTIEENGPLRCVVKVMGEFKDNKANLLIPPVTRIGEIPDSPLRYTIRYFAYKDKGYIKLQTTLRNENFGWAYKDTQAAHNINITEAYLKTTLSGLNSVRSVDFGGYQDTYSTGTYQLLQQETADGTTPSYSWTYNINKQGISQASGEKFDSHVDLRDSSIGLMVADRWFWQNHPIGITITDNEIRFNLWPDTGKEHRILGSIWKTHELLYYFHDTDTTFNDELAHIKKRLIARASDEYYADTNFVWGMVPENITVDYTFPGGESFQNVIDSISATHRANFDENYSTSPFYPNTVLSLREGRKVKLSTNPDRYATGYGWLEFGAMARSAGYGYHNQHYDWSFLAYTGFLRFTDYSMLDIAEELLMHKSDIIQLHDPDASIGEPGLGYEYHGGQRYETDSLFSYHYDYSVSNNADPRKVGHQWTKGLNLQYLFTGEELYLDTLLSAYEHIIRIKSSPTMLTTETRNQYRGIDILCNGYQVTGNINYLNDAWYILKNNLLIAEGGNCTNFLNYSTCTPDRNAGWIVSNLPPAHSFGAGDAWMVEPLIKLYYLLVDAEKTAEATELESFLFRWASTIRFKMIPCVVDQGKYRDNNTQYHPFIMHYAYINGACYDPKYYSNMNRSYMQPYTELFAFMYLKANYDNQAWLNIARAIQKDSLYYTANIDDYVTTLNNVGGGIQGIAADTSIASGSFKHPKSITKTAFHLRVEWLASKKNYPFIDIMKYNK